MLIVVKHVILENSRFYPNPTIGRTLTARFPFDIVSFNLNSTSCGLPTSNKGHTCLLSVIDHFSGFTFAKPLKNKSAYTTSKALTKIFLNFGITITVLSENDANFSYFTMMYKLFSNILGIYKKDKRRDWHETLPYLVNVINTAFSPVIPDDPFYILFGRDFRTPYDEIIESRQ